MKKDNLSIQKIFTHSDITNNIIQIIYFYQVNADAIEDILAKCKAVCQTVNANAPNAAILASCNKVCHLVISVLLSSIQITTLTLLKQYLQLCEDTYKNGVEGVAVTSFTLLISLAVGLLMK